MIYYPYCGFIISYNRNMPGTSHTNMLYSVGHSNRTIKIFIAILRAHSIQQVDDINLTRGL